MNTKQLFITYTLLAGIAALFFVASLPVFAQNSTDAVSTETAVTAEASTTAETNSDETTNTSADGSIDARIDLSAERAERAEALEARRAARAETLAERRAEIETRRTERQATLAENMQQRITNLANTTTERLAGALRRMEAFATRIDTHAANIEARGGDVTEARRHIEVARAKLAEASVALGGINVDVEFVITSDQPRTDWQTVREQYNEITDLIREARGTLREAVSALKTSMHTNTEVQTDTSVDTESAL